MDLQCRPIVAFPFEASLLTNNMNDDITKTINKVLWNPQGKQRD